MKRDRDHLKGIGTKVKDAIAAQPSVNGKSHSGGRQQAPNEQPELVLTVLSDVQARPVEWLWSHRIPRGALTLLDGDPGLGKSTLAVDIAARASRGWEMPPAGGRTNGAEPEGVLLLSAEDDLERTIRPRLDAAGADVGRIVHLDAIRVGGEDRPPVLPWDLALVEGLVKDRGIGIIIIDPFMAFLDGEIDAHRDQDVRRCLHRLKMLAQVTGASILIIRHLNKLAGGPALYRGGGSIGILGATRSALIVGKHPLEPDTCVLASNKSNLGPLPGSLTYKLEPVGHVARVAWGGPTDLTAADILAHPAGRKKQTTSEQCAEAIQDILAAGQIDSEELDRQCRERGFSDNAIHSGRRLAKVRTYRASFGSKCMVGLAGDATPEGEGGQE